MHELSIATSLIELATEAVENAGETGRIESVHVRIGALSGVVIEALDFAWDVAVEGTRCSDARLVIEPVPARVRCPACEAETELAEPPIFRCGACGTPTSSILSGQELDLMSLELVQRPAGAPPETSPEATHS